MNYYALIYELVDDMVNRRAPSAKSTCASP